MKRCNPNRWAALACGMCLGAVVTDGAPKPAAAEQPIGLVAPVPQTGNTPLRDVTLGADGRLEGLLLDRQGTPRSTTPVVITRDGREVASTTTDTGGRFAVTGLRGGEYVLVAGEEQTRCRLWAAGSSPPGAQPLVQVYGGDLVRGRHYGAHNLLTSPAVIGAAIGTAIAVPLALHNREPAS